MDTISGGFVTPMKELGQKSGGLGRGLDSVWPVLGLAWTMLGQVSAGVFPPLWRASTAL